MSIINENPYGANFFAAHSKTSIAAIEKWVTMLAYDKSRRRECAALMEGGHHEK
jgi:hypothetical protein